MRSAMVFASGFAIGAVAFMAGSWAIHCREPLTVPDNESFPDQFFRQAASLGSQERWPQQRKQELLRQAASRSQLNHVAASGPYWAEFQKSLGVGSEGDRAGTPAALGERIAFQEQLEAALTNARSVSEFEHAWPTWQLVDDQIAASRELLVGKIDKELASLSKPSETSTLTDVVNEIKRLTPFRAKQPEVAAVLAATPPSEPMPAPVLKIVALAEEANLRSINSVRAVLAEIESRRAKLHASTVRIDPEKAPTQGLCTGYLTQLVEVEAATQEADLNTWLELRGASTESAASSERVGKTANEAIGKLSAALLDAESAAGNVRRLAYNLWAVREIYAAESVDSWASRLGQIDNGMLEPVVSALFASAYARRMAEVKDPERRSVIVQSILTDPKVTLAAF